MILADTGTGARSIVECIAILCDRAGVEVSVELIDARLQLLQAFAALIFLESLAPAIDQLLLGYFLVDEIELDTKGALTS